MGPSIKGGWCPETEGGLVAPTQCPERAFNAQQRSSNTQIPVKHFVVANQPIYKGVSSLANSISLPICHSKARFKQGRV